MNKRKIRIWLLISVVILCMCGREKPWVGTYMLRVNDENREVFNQFQQLKTPWPHVILKKDGTFILIQPQASGSGIYRVEGTRLVMTLTEYNGGLPQGNLAQTKTIETKNNFQFIMFEGANGDPWVKLPE